MRFSGFGSIGQFSGGSEGDVILRAGLIWKREDGFEVEAFPTEQLDSCFSAKPDLEAVYPLLVELVMARRGFGSDEAAMAGLKSLGLNNGLAIEVAIRDAIGSRAVV